MNRKQYKLVFYLGDSKGEARCLGRARKSISEPSGAIIWLWKGTTDRYQADRLVHSGALVQCSVDMEIPEDRSLGTELFVKGAGTTEGSSESLHPDLQTKKNKQGSFYPNDTH